MSMMRSGSGAVSEIGLSSFFLPRFLVIASCALGQKMLLPGVRASAWMAFIIASVYMTGVP